MSPEMTVLCDSHERVIAEHGRCGSCGKPWEQLEKELDVRGGRHQQSFRAEANALFGHCRCPDRSGSCDWCLVYYGEVA